MRNGVRIPPRAVSCCFWRVRPTKAQILRIGLTYNIKHVILLGRVTSGKGGDTILAVAKEVLSENFPEYAHFNLCMPSEYMRRVGQSIAAASLPKNRD